MDLLGSQTENLFNDDEELAEKRLNICRECPLYLVTSRGPICNPKLYMNDKGEVSTSPKSGFKRGCSCQILKKSRLTYGRCNHGKW